MGEKKILIHTHRGSTEMGPKKWQLFILFRERNNKFVRNFKFFKLADKIEFVTAYKIVHNFVTMITVAILQLFTMITK